MKQLLNETDKFIVYKYGNVYRVHFYEDVRRRINEMESFITKSFSKVKHFL